MTGPPDQHSRRQFEDMFARTRTPVLGYLLRRTVDAADAADLLAEVYLIAWRRRDDVPAGDQARLWLYGVARRVLANHHRRQLTQRRLTDRLAAQLTAALDEWDDQHSEAAAVRAAVAKLPDDDREVIELAAYERLSPAQIALVTGRSPGAVRVRLHRARRQLRVALQDTAAPPADEPPAEAIAGILAPSRPMASPASRFRAGSPL